MISIYVDDKCPLELIIISYNSLNFTCWLLFVGTKDYEPQPQNDSNTVIIHARTRYSTKFKIDIIDDDIVEEKEYYFLDIHSVSDQRVSIDSNSFTINIPDDDSKYKI